MDNEKNEKEEKDEKEKVVCFKKNHLRTKLLPSLLMLIGGAVALFYCKKQDYEVTTLLFVVFITLLVFAVIGTIIKTIIDQFNMNMSYSDYINDGGDLIDKGSSEE